MIYPFRRELTARHEQSDRDWQIEGGAVLSDVRRGEINNPLRAVSMSGGLFTFPRRVGGREREPKEVPDEAPKEFRAGDPW